MSSHEKDTVSGYLLLLLHIAVKKRHKMPGAAGLVEE